MLRWAPVAVLSLTVSAQVPAVTTRGFDNQRSEWNAQETVLTQASVRAAGLTRQPAIPVIGDARGMEAQPLVLPGVATARGVRDVMVLPSEANVVRGVDAHDGSAIWQVTLGMPVKSNGTIDMHEINDHVGCMSTGVIDPEAQRLYQVCWVSIDGSGSPQSGRYFLFVLNVKDGTRIGAPVNVQGRDTAMWKQRSSLALATVGGVKTVFFAHGSVYETAAGFTGGILAFDVATNKVAATLPLTAGIWMAGQGLSVDAQGYVYAITGNGDFDPGKGWFGESFLKLKYTLPAGRTAATLAVVDWWSPWTDDQRASGVKMPPGKLAGASLPTEKAKPVGGSMSLSMRGARLEATRSTNGEPMLLVYPDPMASGAWSDEDWGSAGPASLFQIGVCVAAGKDGIGYPIACGPGKSLGETTLAQAGTAANYAKLAAPCQWLSVDPGPVACDPPDPKTLNFFPWGDTAHVHMTPVQMWDPLLKSWTIFVWGENGQLRKWAVSNGGALTFAGRGNEFASAGVRGNTPGGMPGGFCSGSSNGVDANSYLLVCAIPYGDANATVTNGRLLVYDPVHVVNGIVPVLWDSQRWGWNLVFNKFLPPMVWGGQVYYPNFAGSVDVLR